MEKTYKRVLSFLTGEWQFYQMAIFVEVTVNEIASIVDKVGLHVKYCMCINVSCFFKTTGTFNKYGTF